MNTFGGGRPNVSSNRRAQIYLFKKKEADILFIKKIINFLFRKKKQEVFARGEFLFFYLESDLIW